MLPKINFKSISLTHKRVTSPPTQVTCPPTQWNTISEAISKIALFRKEGLRTFHTSNTILAREFM